MYPSALWKVKNSRSSATFVVVSNDCAGFEVGIQHLVGGRAVDRRPADEPLRRGKLLRNASGCAHWMLNPNGLLH